MNPLSTFSTWLADTPLQVPLTYFSSLHPSGHYLWQEQESVLYSYANQLFGWGTYPADIIGQEFNQMTEASHLWLLAPPDWKTALNQLVTSSSLKLCETVQLFHLYCRTPQEPIILPSGLFIAPLTEYNDEIGYLFKLFQQEQKLSLNEIDPRQQFAAVKNHGQCWGLYRERQLVGKLDVLYSTGKSAWGGGMILLPELRGKQLGSNFMLHFLQQSSLTRLEIQVEPVLLPYYLRAGCDSVSQFYWFLISSRSARDLDDS
jgi:hypothetical protein